MYFENSCIFGEFPLDPCDHMRGNEDELAKKSKSKSARFLYFRDGEALMEDEAGYVPKFAPEAAQDDMVIFLGEDDKNSYFACNSSQIGRAHV